MSLNFYDYPKIENSEDLLWNKLYLMKEKGINNPSKEFVIPGVLIIFGGSNQFKKRFEIYNVYGPIPEPKSSE